MDNFFEGATARITARFEDENHVLADPTTITAEFSNPAGVKTTWVFGADVELVRESVGVYHYDIDLNLPRVWHYRIEGTGTVKAVSQNQLNVVAANPA